MFAKDSVQATFGRFLGAFPVEAASSKQGGRLPNFKPSGLGQAANGLLVVVCLAVAGLSPWMLRRTFEGVRQFSGGIHWALLVAAVASLLAVAGGLLHALRNANSTAQLFARAAMLRPQIVVPRGRRRLHPLVVFDALRGVGEALRLYATLTAEYSHAKLAFWLLYYLVHLAPLAVDLQIWALSVFTQTGFQTVNDALDKITAAEIPSKKEEAIFWKRSTLESKLIDLRRLHSELRSLASGVNDRYGLDMLVTIVTGRLLVVLYLYVMVATVLRGQLEQIIFYEIYFGLSVLAAFSRIYALCHRFEEAAKQAGNTLNILQRLSVERFDPKVSEEINIFSLQVQSCQVSFTALGFFSLDIALISSIVGTVMTYLVILIQFESSDVDESPK